MKSAPIFQSIILPSPLPGSIRIGVSIGAHGPNQIDFLPADTPLTCTSDSTIQLVQQWIAAYFQDPNTPMQLELAPEGTAYQQRVWERLRAIPIGTTLSYGELAEELGSGARAVAAACRANPIPLLIPCHRVVARNGLGGYMGAVKGDELKIKQWLLHHEGALR